MRPHYLNKLFAPDTVAVFGASEKNGSVGGQVFRNLQEAGYAGRLFPVNPKHDTVFGEPCYADMGEIAHMVDMVVIATPAPTVPGIVSECGEAGVEVSVGRVGRAELYEYARDAADLSPTFVALVVLSTLVAAGGMLRDQTAVVIGAMMIAPLLGPSLVLALSTTLGDLPLLSQSLRANVAGGGLALVLAVVMGVLLPVDPSVDELALRTVIGLPDVVLAAAAGAAGVLSVTRDQATGLVGVMVAVALLPPAVALGLLLGAGHLGPALQAGLLTGTNIVALNLAAVCTFLALGVRPRDWRDLEQARTSIRIALALWGLALLLLLAFLWLQG